MAIWNYLYIYLLPAFSPTQKNATSICTQGMSILLCLLYGTEPFTKKNIQSGAKGNLPLKDRWLSLSFTWHGSTVWPESKDSDTMQNSKTRHFNKRLSLLSYGWFKESCIHSPSCDSFYCFHRNQIVIIKKQKHFYRNKYKWKMW